MAKDVMLYILGKLKQDAAVNKAIEYTGEAVDNMSMSERMVLCNMAVEMGAETAYITPDAITRAYLEPRLGYWPDFPTTDADFSILRLTALISLISSRNWPLHIASTTWWT